MKTELKTLKDIGGTTHVMKSWIKAEAIKWVKEDNYYEFIKLFPFKILNAREMKVLKDFAKWYFDIIEEDFKKLKPEEYMF